MMTTDPLTTTLLFSGIGLTLLILIIVFIKRLKRVNEKKHAYDLTFLQIRMPNDNEVEIAAAQQMFSNLYGFKKLFLQSLFSQQYRISFEIVSKKEGISFFVIIPDEIATLVEKQIHAAYPSAEIDIVNPHEVWDRGSYTQVSELKLKGPSFYPIKDYEDLEVDSLNSITSAMSKLDEDEVLAVQYVIQPAGEGWRLRGQKTVSSIKAKASDPEAKVNVDASFTEGIEKKIKESGFYTKIRIIAISKDKMNTNIHIQNIKSGFEQFTDPSYNRFLLKGTMFPFKTLEDFIYRNIHTKELVIPILNVKIYGSCPILNTKELATVFHFPNKNVQTPNIDWLTARKSAAPVNIHQEGLYLGTSSFRGVSKDIYISEKDRMRHFYIIGQTGTGKSFYMMYLAYQDILAGNGVAIIDPHGTDIDELLEKIPPERMDDVVLFDPSDTERPLGINMLEAHSEEEKHMIVNAFIGLLYKLYDPNRQGIMGPQLERAIRNVMLTAMVDPEATMVDVLRLLIDDNYNKKFLDKVTDPLVRRYWIDEVANTSKNRKGEMMGYFVSKFDRFVTDKTMRNILGQPKTAVNFTDIMDNKKILLIKLAKGVIGEENSNFLGLLMVPRILAAALSRQKRISEGDKNFPPFYLYVDEFQNFATDDFATILSEARKYKLALTVAHQFMPQLEDNIKDAILGNVGTKAIFRIGINDAQLFESEFEPTFTTQDMNRLPMGNYYMRLLVDGQPTPPFSAHLPGERVFEIEGNPETAQYIKKMSREKYGADATEVEKYITERAGFNEEKQDPTKRKMPLPKIPF